MMLVTPRSSGRTIRPATTVANHMKLTWRENAGRNDWIALQQDSQSDSGRPFAGFSMVPSMGDSRVGHLRTNQGFTIRQRYRAHDRGRGLTSNHYRFGPDLRSEGASQARGAALICPTAQRLPRKVGPKRATPGVSRAKKTRRQ